MKKILFLMAMILFSPLSHADFDDRQSGWGWERHEHRHHHNGYRQGYYQQAPNGYYQQPEIRYYVQPPVYYAPQPQIRYYQQPTSPLNLNLRPPW